jgi:hypothetical protein
LKEKKERFLLKDFILRGSGLRIDLDYKKFKVQCWKSLKLGPDLKKMPGLSFTSHPTLNYLTWNFRLLNLQL